MLTASSNVRKKGSWKNEVKLRWSELPQWIGLCRLWRQTSPQRIPWDTLSPGKHRNFHSERFRPRWYVCGFHDSISQSCWKMKSFAQPAWGMYRRPENLPIRLQGTEPLSESAWHRSRSHHMPAFSPALPWAPARFPLVPRQRLSSLSAAHRQEFPHEMHLAALPRGAGKGLTDCRNQPGVSIWNDKP